MDDQRINLSKEEYTKIIESIAEIKSGIHYMNQRQDDLIDDLTHLAPKSELLIHRWIIGGLCASMMYIFSTIARLP